MGQIPVQQERAVATRPIGTPYAQLDVAGAFTGGVQQGLAQLGQGVQQGVDAVAKAAEKARDEAEATATTEALTALKGYGTKAYYDAKTGFVTLQGKNALEASAKTLQGFEDYSRKLEESLPSDRARKAFRAHAARESQQFYTQVESHAGRENERHQDETFQANAKASLDAIAANPDRLDLEISAMQGPIAAYNQIKGGGEAGLRAKQAAAAQAAVATALDSYMGRARNGDGTAAAKARELFKLHANDLGKLRDEYEGKIGAVGAVADAQGAVSQQLGKNATTVVLPSGGTAKRLDTDAFVDGIETSALSPEAKKEARSAAVLVAHEYSKQWDKTLDEVFDQAFSSYLASPVRGTAGLAAVDPRVKYFLVKRAPKEWAKLEDVANKADDEAARHAKLAVPRARREEATPEQRDAFNEFTWDLGKNESHYTAGDYSRAAFNREWGLRLSDKDYASAVKEISGRNARFGGNVAKEDVPLEVDRALREIGSSGDHKLWPNAPPKAWTREQRDLYYRTRGKLVLDASAEARKLGHEPPNAWYLNWIDTNVASTIEVPEPRLGSETLGKLFPTKKAPVELDLSAKDSSAAAPAPEGEERSFPSPVKLKLPKADEDKLRASFTRKGVTNPSDEQLRAAYQALHQGQ